MCVLGGGGGGGGEGGGLGWGVGFGGVVGGVGGGGVVVVECGVDNLMFRKGWHGDDAMVICDVCECEHGETDLHCSCRGHLVLFLMHNLYTRMVVQQ